MRVAQSVHNWIQQGRYSPGDSLPPVRQLANDFEVNKGTVVRALSDLQDAGLIERQGRRLCVAEHDQTQANETQSIHETQANTENSSIHPSNTLISGMLLVVSSIEPRSGVHRSPFWSMRVVEGALSAAQAAHHHAVLLHPDKLDEATLIKLAATQPIGCIVAECVGDRCSGVIKALDKAGIPIVRFGDEVEDSVHSQVNADHRAGTHALVHWLHDHGCRRMLRYVPHTYNRSPPHWLKARRAGYEQALEELGLTKLDAVEYIRPDIGQWDDKPRFEMCVRLAAGHLAEYLIGDQRIDAILTPSDAQTFEVSAAAKLLGRKPGKDLFIAGYDNYAKHAWQYALEPTLPAVTVTHDYVAIGRALVDSLLNTDQSTNSATNVVVPPVLCVPG